MGDISVGARSPLVTVPAPKDEGASRPQATSVADVGRTASETVERASKQQAPIPGSAGMRAEASRAEDSFGKSQSKDRVKLGQPGASRGKSPVPQAELYESAETRRPQSRLAGKLQPGRQYIAGKTPFHPQYAEFKDVTLHGLPQVDPAQFKFRNHGGRLQIKDMAGKIGGVPTEIGTPSPDGALSDKDIKQLQPGAWVDVGDDAEVSIPGETPVGYAMRDIVAAATKNEPKPTWPPVGELDVKQGKAQDCYLIAAAKGMDMQKGEAARALRESVKENLKGDYQFNICEVLSTNVKRKDLLRTGRVQDCHDASAVLGPLQGPKGMKVLEFAYGKARNEGVAYRPPSKADARASSLPLHPLQAVRGGRPEHVVAELANKEDFPSNFIMNPASIPEIGTDSVHNKEQFDDLKKRMEKGYVAFVVSVPRPPFAQEDREPRSGLLYQHAYLVDEIDTNDKTMTLRDPHDTSKVIKAHYKDNARQRNGIEQSLLTVSSAGPFEPEKK